MRVLTFNSHQPYLHLLASALPWSFGVVTPRLPSGKIKSWSDRIRPLSENVKIYASLQLALQDQTWDWVLLHNVHDLVDCRELALPKVYVMHGTFSGRVLQDRSEIDRDVYVKNFEILLKAHRCRVVYISQLKQKDWGIPGEVIRSAVDPQHYGGYRGERRMILLVCNHLRERGRVLGWEVYRAVCRDLPNLVLGENRGLPGSRMAASWEDLKEQYRSCRVYLHTAIYPHEDGYNLAVLEAMATGMPVATLHNPTSPIRDGVEGVVGETAEQLRQRVIWLMDHPDEATQMGSAARRRLEDEFPLPAFRHSWQSIAEQLVRGP